MKKYLKLEKDFIENEFLNAPPVYSVLYVYLLNKSNSGIVKINLSQLEDETRISISEILNFLKYFDRRKILSVQTELNGDTIINFKQENDLSENLDTTIEVKKEKVSKNERRENKSYSVEEITNISRESNEIAELFSYVEEATGNLLDYSDLNIIYSFYDYYKLPIEVIYFMIAYCINNGKRNIRYMEKVAKGWSENNIKTLDDAEKYLMDFNKEYKEILKALGVTTGVVDANKKFMDKWLLDDRMSLELIIEACNRTTTQTGGSSMKYTDSIINNWKEKNIKTLEEAIKFDEDFKKENKNKQTKVVATTTAKPKFNDYKQRNLDFDKIQQQAMQKQLKGD